MNIVDFATRRRVTVGMTTLTLVLFGLIALSSLRSTCSRIFRIRR